MYAPFHLVIQEIEWIHHLFTLSCLAFLIHEILNFELNQTEIWSSELVQRIEGQPYQVYKAL